MSGRVVHFEVPFDDGDRARSFYKDVFGWQLQEMPEMNYTLVTSGPSGDSGPTEAGFINGGMMARAGGPHLTRSAFGWSTDLLMRRSTMR